MTTFQELRNQQRDLLEQRISGREIAQSVGCSESTTVRNVLKRVQQEAIA